MNSKAPFGYAILSGVFLFIDRLLKWEALHSWGTDRLIGQYFGWEPFLNDGIAFGIGIPLYIIVLLTIVIISLVLYFYNMHLKLSNGRTRPSAYFGLMLLLVGSVSNLVDRLIYHSAVDYLRIFTSVINMADVLIIVGFVLYFSSLKHLK